MLLILPVYFDADDIWASNEGTTLLKERFDELKRSWPDDLLVISDRRETCELAGEVGCRSMFLDRVSDPFASDHVATAVRAWRRDERWAGEDMLVLDFRHPQLTPDVLAGAREIHQRSGSNYLIGLTEIKDHPCQFTRSLRQVQCSIVNFPDTTFRGVEVPADWAITQPFRHEWPFADNDGGHVFSRNESMFNAEFETAGIGGGKPLWFREGDTLARIIYPVDGVENSVHVWGGGFQELNISSRVEDGVAILSLTREIGEAMLVIKTAYMFDGTVNLEKVRDVFLPAGEDRCEIRVPMDDAAGALLYVYEPEIDGGYDEVEECRPPDAPWGVRGDQKIVNLATGEIIQGRQEMPPMFTVSEGLLGLRAHAGLPADREALLASSAHVVLTQDQDLRVETVFDLVRCRVAREGGGDGR